MEHWYRTSTELDNGITSQSNIKEILFKMLKEIILLIVKPHHHIVLVFTISNMIAGDNRNVTSEKKNFFNDLFFLNHC